MGRMYFSERLRKRKTGETIAVHATAARGDPKAIKKIIKESQKD